MGTQNSSSQQKLKNGSSGQSGNDKTSAKHPKLKIVLLILASLLLLSTAAYAGYKYAKSDEKKSDKTSELKSSSERKDEGTDVTAEMVGPDSGDYEVELPTDWVTGSCADNPDIFFLAPTTELLGKCQTEYFGTVAISKIEGDQRRTEEYYVADDYYGSPAFSAVTIDSLPGYRVSYSVATEGELGYPPINTFEYVFDLYDATDDVTYKIAYRQLPDDDDYQAHFVAIAESFNKL